jgi:hypothetical protein
MLVMCKRCKKMRGRDFLKFRLRQKKSGATYRERVMVDELGRQWNGYVCPQCLSDEKCAYREVHPRSKRKCKDCGRRLVPSRWAHCHECRPTLGSDPFEGYEVHI